MSYVDPSATGFSYLNVPNAPAPPGSAIQLTPEEQRQVNQQATQQGQQQVAEGEKQKAAEAKKTAQQKIQDTINSLNDMIAGASYPQMYGAGSTAFGSQIGQKLATLPATVAQQWLNQHQGALKNTPLYNAITSSAKAVGAPAAAAGAQRAAYDPLALQTMWHDVFGPAFNNAVKIAGGAGSQYLQGMQQAIAGSNASPAQQKAMLGQAQAQAALINNTAFTPQGNPRAAAQIPFDTLLGTLGQATAAAQAAGGEAAKVYGVQQAAAAAPYYTGTGSTGGNLSTSGAGALLNPLIGGSSATPASAISANQTTNPLMPNIPGYPVNIP
jgi:hypothetical protein